MASNFGRFRRFVDVQKGGLVRGWEGRSVDVIDQNLERAITILNRNLRNPVNIPRMVRKNSYYLRPSQVKRKVTDATLFRYKRSYFDQGVDQILAQIRRDAAPK
eukprot:TRINITY_DN11657_c0_g1::TRINITY_DN11657_c0_g1_i1::g.17555::m.17555 TRINITY_DN11657_c0_g1::TRINITY_DN11657_c0_g1_i1::g.17555  ORF type:complete len:104 (-),score=-3.43,Ribosomal_S21/PF01165.15/7.4e+03,Ribosomal_S21/PF01165.15/7.5e-05 TRINITY_DN11657_c0_g1_i1:229-540(-)